MLWDLTAEPKAIEKYSDLKKKNMITFVDMNILILELLVYPWRLAMSELSKKEFIKNRSGAWGVI